MGIEKIIDAVGRGLVSSSAEEKATGASAGLEMLGGVLRSGVEPAARSTREFLKAYSDMPWLRAVLSRVSYDVASVDWHLYVARNAAGKALVRRDIQGAPKKARRKLLGKMMSDGDVEQIEEHPMLDLLHKSNPLHSGVQARRLTQIHVDCVGEGFQMIERNRLGVPFRLWPIPPTWVRSTPTPKTPGFEMSFRGWQGVVPASEVIWYLDPDPANPYGRGSGTARALADELEIDEYAARTVKSHFFNSAKPDLLIYPKGDATMAGSDARRLEEKWNRHNRGFWRNFRTFFLKRAVEVKQIDTSFKSAQLMDIRQHERDAIMQVFGVSPEVLGIIRPGSARATVTMADVIYAKRVVMPRLEFTRSVMQMRLAPQYDPALILDYESPEVDDIEQQLAAAKGATWALTQDEWREMSGHEALPDDRGKVFLVPKSMVAVADLSQATGAEGGGGQARGSGKRDRRRSAGVDASRADAGRAPDPADEVLAAFRDAGEHVSAEQWVAMTRKGHKDDPPAVRLADRSWPAWRDEQVRAWRALEVDVVGLAEALREGDTSRAIAAYGGIDVIREAMASIARERGRERYLRGAKLGLEQVPEQPQRAATNISFTEVNPEATAWAEANAAELVTGVDDDVREAIAELIASANANGMSPRDLAKALADRGGIGLLPRQRVAVERFRAQMIADGVSPSLIERRVEKLEAAKLRFRATMIARTETISALTHGQQAAWDLAIRRGELPAEGMGREWIAAVDACEECIDVDGEVVGMDEEFSAGVSMPPLHPLCRCGVGLVDLRTR